MLESDCSISDHFSVVSHVLMSRKSCLGVVVFVLYFDTETVAFLFSLCIVDLVLQL